MFLVYLITFKIERKIAFLQKPWLHNVMQYLFNHNLFLVNYAKDSS
jgi:hypothetical protein